MDTRFHPSAGTDASGESASARGDLRASGRFYRGYAYPYFVAQAGGS